MRPARTLLGSVAAVALMPAAATACDSLCTSPNFSQPYPNSFWQLRLPRDVLTEDSAAARAAVNRLAKHAGTSVGVAARHFNARIYVVPNSQPVVPVVINGSDFPTSGSTSP